MKHGLGSKRDWAVRDGPWVDRGACRAHFAQEAGTIS